MSASHNDGLTGRNNIPLLTCAFLASLTTGGTSYAFGLYGSALKKALRLTQSQLDTVSSSNFCAGLLSWIPGLCVDRYGPRFALSLGGVLGAFSLLSYWSVARGFVEVSRDLIVPTLSTLGVFIFVSTSLVTGSVFKIIVSTCGPGSKGSAVGAAKGYVGVGAGAYSCLFEALRVKSTSDLDFLPMAAFFAIFACTIPALLLLPSKKDMKDHLGDDRVNPLHLRTIYVGLTALATLVAGTSVVQLFTKPSEDDSVKVGPHCGRALLVLSCWMGPIVALLFLPTTEFVDNDPASLDGHSTDSGSGSVRLLEEDRSNGRGSSDGFEWGETASISMKIVKYNEVSEQLLHESSSSASSSRASSADVVNRTLFQMIQTVPAWLFAWTAIILVGGGTIMTNNMGQMVEALEFPPTVAPASLALFSVAQAAARVVTGAVSESALTWSIPICGLQQGVPRPVFLVVAAIAGIMAHLLLAMATTQPWFVIGVALSGVAFGMVWPLMVLIIGEVFGTVNVGANYMFYDGFSSAMGTLLLSKFVAQEVYEHHIDRNDSESDGLTCYGDGCFRLSHLIIAGLSMTCVCTSMAMVYATRHTYSKLPSNDVGLD